MFEGTYHRNNQNSRFSQHSTGDFATLHAAAPHVLNKNSCIPHRFQLSRCKTSLFHSQFLDWFTHSQPAGNYLQDAEVSPDIPTIPGQAAGLALESLPHSLTPLRFQVLINQDVVAIELEAALVTDDHFLNALEALDENVVHICKENFHQSCSMFGSQVLPELLNHPLAALRHPNTITCKLLPTDEHTFNLCDFFFQSLYSQARILSKNPGTRRQGLPTPQCN